MKFTDEQDYALDLALKGESFKQIARAGCGKTFICRTMGRMFKDTSHPDTLYITFTNAGAAEARKNFSDNVVPMTFNSIAFNLVDDRIKSKTQMPKEPSKFLAQRYNLKPSSFVNKSGSLIALSSTFMAMLVQKSIQNFCQSADLYIQKKHIEIPIGCDTDRADHLRDSLFPHVNRYWNEQIDPNNGFGIIHGVYVKIWHQTGPDLEVPLIFDEFQDADDLMIDVIAKQSNQVILVGDDFQSIYGWRGAVNGLKKIDLQEVYLTQSFRFGQEVGDLASSTLKLLGNKIPVRGLSTKSTLVDYEGDGPTPDVYLCRTNAGTIQVLTETLARGERTGIDSKTLDQFSEFSHSAKFLMENRKPNHPVLGMFNTWKDFREFTDSPYGSEYRPYVTLIDTYGIQQLDSVVKNAPSIDKAHNLATTFHRFKGREAKNVQICEFVNYTGKPDDDFIHLTEEETMLLYVGLTRATERLDVSVIRDELAMSLRSVRPTIISELLSGRGEIFDEPSQNLSSVPESSRTSRSELVKKHLLAMGQSEITSKNSKSALQM